MAFATDAQRRWWFAHLALGPQNTREAAHPRDAHDFFGASDQEWFDALSEQERDRLRDYINMEYQSTSSFLRGRMGARDNPANASRKTLVDNVDRIFAKSPRLPDRLTVYRGLSQDISGDVGAVITDEAFQSTSLDVNTAKRFSRNGGTVARITVPAGKRYIPLGAVDPKRGTGDAEFELLFDRSAKYRVRKRSKAADGRTYVDLEML